MTTRPKSNYSQGSVSQRGDKIVQHIQATASTLHLFLTPENAPLFQHEEVAVH